MAKKESTERAYLETERLVTRLVQRENERLTRLLRNLYQEFRLGRGDRLEFYEHICRELAQYFHCDCCQLYLVRQERLSGSSQECTTGERLVLVAAFGPWRQAIEPRYVRRRVETHYELTSHKHTARRFRATDAVVDLCRLDYRPKPHKRRSRGGRKPSTDVEWHLVWRRDNLYTVSRNILSCPILRHRSRGQRDPYPIGVIKLENRRPHLSRAFESDWPTEWLYLGPYFKLCAVAAYIRDLDRRAEEADRFDALFAPFHDADGWRQHFQQHPAGAAYFDEMLNWQRDRYEQFEREQADWQCVAAALRGEYKEAAEQLSVMMDLVVELEVLLQELTAACLAIWPDAKSPPGFRSALKRLPEGAPAPSLFNAVGVAKDKEKTDWLRDALFVGVRSVVDSSRPDQDPEASCHDIAKKIEPEAPHEPPVGQAARHAGASLWDRLTQKFREEGGIRGGLFEEMNRATVARNSCALLECIAQSIQATRKEAAVADLAPARIAAHHCAEEVIQLLGGEADRDPVTRLARASAAACMYAHTFDPRLDRTRLFSIQSHVSQVLDNYLMDKARLSGLEISFDHVEILGLTESSVDGLERLQKLVGDAKRCLRTFLERGAMRVDPNRDWSMTPRVVELRKTLDELVRQMLKNRYAPIDLLRVDINPSLRLPRDARASIREALKENRLLLVGVKPAIWQVRFKVTGADVRAPRGRGFGPGLGRPVPRWLFALNDELDRYCQTLRGF